MLCCRQLTANLGIETSNCRTKTKKPRFLVYYNFNSQNLSQWVIEFILESFPLQGAKFAAIFNEVKSHRNLRHTWTVMTMRENNFKVCSKLRFPSTINIDYTVWHLYNCFQYCPDNLCSKFLSAQILF